jgi:hypothetical protein
MRLGGPTSCVGSPVLFCRRSTRSSNGVERVAQARAALPRSLSGAPQRFRVRMDRRGSVPRLSSMITPEQAMTAALPERNFVPTPRQEFHGRSAVTCAHMMRQLIGAPAALRMGLPADVGYAVGWEREPPVVRELMRAASAVCPKVALRPRDAATRAAESGEAR